MTPVESFAEVNQTRLFYRRAGQGPALLFMHGFTLDLRMWQPQFEALSDRFEVVAYDQRGFGRSALPTNATYKHYEDAAALLEHLGLEQVVVVGHSIGAVYGLELCLARPELVKGFASLCMAGLGTPAFPETVRQMFGAIQKAASQGNIEQARRIWSEAGWFESALEHPDAKGELYRMLRDYSGWHWTHKNPAKNLEPPAVERLEQLTVPALVIDGERDLDYNRAVADVLQQRLPKVRRLRMPGAGHMANLEAPETVNAALGEFAHQLTMPGLS